MAVTRNTDELTIDALPTIGVFLLTGGSPVTATAAAINVVVMNESNGVAKSLKVSIIRKTIDGFYGFNLVTILTLLSPVNTVFAIALSSGTTTIDTQFLGRFRVVSTLIEEESRTRLVDTENGLREIFSKSFELFGGRLDDSEAKFEAFDEKLSKELTTVRTTVKNINSELIVLRKTRR